MYERCAESEHRKGVLVISASGEIAKMGWLIEKQTEIVDAQHSGVSDD